MILRLSIRLLIFTCTLILLRSALATPIAKCRLCKECEENANSTQKLTTRDKSNQTDAASNDLDETAELISAILGTENATRQERSYFTRSKRQSFVEKRPCPNRFQLEVILIPASIMAIPLVLLCFLFCACFCARKEERARMPKSWYSKKRKRHDTADDLYFGSDYVKRKSSQKTRFQTTVTIIERRRESAMTISSDSPPEADRPQQTSRGSQCNIQTALFACSLR